MPSPSRRERRRPLVLATIAVLAALVAPASASAHAELVSSDPVTGASVPSPYSGPITLVYTEALAVGSKADLYGAGHQLVASATIDAGTMTIDPAGSLDPGAYTVEWVSIADDGDLLRGTITFTVAAAASQPPSAEPSETASAGPSIGPSIPLSAASSAAATPAPSSATSSGTGGAGSDVILPIVIALIVAAAGALYLVRRNRPT